MEILQEPVISHSGPETQQAPGPQPEPRPPFNEVSVLFPLLTLVTVAYLAMIVAEFFLPKAVHMPGMMMPVYISLLSAYAADKEIRRWVGVPEPPRKGSLFVHLWVLLFLALVIVNFFRTEYPLPQDLGKVVLQVLAVFFGSRTSKYIKERQSGAAMDPSEISAQRERILELIRTRGRVVRADVMELFGIGRTTATSLLEDMVRDGVIRRIGEKKGTHYLATETKPVSND